MSTETSFSSPNCMNASYPSANNTDVQKITKNRSFNLLKNSSKPLLFSYQDSISEKLQKHWIFTAMLASFWLIYVCNCRVQAFALSANVLATSLILTSNHALR
jgi:hypothetical protein